MIKKMRRTIILVVFAILLIVFIGITATVYVISTRRESDEVNRILTQLSTNPVPPLGMPPNSVRHSKSIVIITNTTTLEESIFYDQNFYTSDEVSQIITTITNLGQTSGSVNNIFFRFFSFDDVTVLAAVNRSSEIQMNQYNLILLISAELTSLLILMILTYFLAVYATKPLSISLKKQQEFIADASHELKTPLAIISSNAEVLKDDFGSNKWTTNIIDQVVEMNLLVNQLLNLAALEEGSKVIKITEVNLSELLEAQVLSFEPRAFEENKQFSYAIDPNIMVKSNKSYLLQLIKIFLDNAIKHSAVNGEIKVNLTFEKRPILTFYNSGCKITKDMESKIFDRFIKLDEARVNDGTFGLGLAIAKKICERLNYQLTLKCEYDQYTKFTIKL